MSNKIDEYMEMSTKNFLQVRDILRASNCPMAYNRVFKKPYKFYRKNSVEETVQILLNEVKEN